jgi:signal peptidase I
VNGKPLDEPYVIAADDAAFDPGSFEEVTVPRDSYFVLGDHRDNSADSRVFGSVPRSLLVGRAVGIYWPLGHAGLLPTTAKDADTAGIPDRACAESA